MDLPLWFISNMIKLLILSIAFIAVSCSWRQKVSNPLLWKVSKGDQVFYFLGTMHVGFQLDDFPAEIKETIKSSELLAVESSLADEEALNTAFKEKLQKYISRMYDPNPGLQRSLSPKAWSRLSFTLNSPEIKNYVKGLGLRHPPTEVHPAMLFKIFLHIDEIKQNFALYHPDLAEGNTKWEVLTLKEEQASILDREVESLALKNGIKVISLDNAKLRADAIFHEGKDYFLPGIEALFSGESTHQNYLDRLRVQQSYYREGDEKKLTDFISQVNAPEKLLYNRNKHWFDVLIQIPEKKVFVGVGAAHLIGNESIFKYFKEREFTIERVVFAK